MDVTGSGAVLFRNTVRAMARDSSVPSLFFMLGGGVLLTVWLIWFCFGSVGMTVVSRAARLQSSGDPHILGSSVDARVVAVFVNVGDRVRAGTRLIELDRQRQALHLEEEESRQAALRAQLELQQRQYDSLETALGDARSAAASAIAESEARQRESMQISILADVEAKRLSALEDDAPVSESVMDQARGRASQSRSAAEAARAASARTQRERAATIAQSEAVLAQLRSEIVRNQGELERSVIYASRLREEIGERVIRAPITGTIGEIAPLAPGAAVEVGEWVATVVPPGATRVLAFFDAADAVGKIKPGQSARLTFEAYPWLYHGVGQAIVSRVGAERDDGTIRVELTLSGHQLREVPLQHGLSAEVVVEIERLSPMRFVLRSVGGTRTVVGNATRVTVKSNGG